MAQYGVGMLEAMRHGNGRGPDTSGGLTVNVTVVSNGENPRATGRYVAESVAEVLGRNMRR